MQLLITEPSPATLDWSYELPTWYFRQPRVSTGQRGLKPKSCYGSYNPVHKFYAYTIETKSSDLGKTFKEVEAFCSEQGWDFELKDCADGIIELIS